MLSTLTIISLVATIVVRTASPGNYFRYPLTFVVSFGVIASMTGIWLFNRKLRPVKAFLSPCLYLFFMLAGACWDFIPLSFPPPQEPIAT